MPGSPVRHQFLTCHPVFNTKLLFLHKFWPWICMLRKRKPPKSFLPLWNINIACIIFTESWSRAPFYSNNYLTLEQLVCDTLTCNATIYDDTVIMRSNRNNFPQRYPSFSTNYHKKIRNAHLIPEEFFFNVNTFLKSVSTSKSRVTYDLDTDTTTHKIIRVVGSPLYHATPVSIALPKSHVSL